MTDIRVIPTKNYKGKLDSVDLEKKIEELMSGGFEITHAQNDYIILMKLAGINEITVDSEVGVKVEDWLKYSHFGKRE